MWMMLLGFHIWTDQEIEITEYSYLNDIYKTSHRISRASIHIKAWEHDQI